MSPFGSIEVSPSSRTVSRNTNTMFTCTAEGGPNTMYRWVMNDSIDTSNLPYSLEYVVGTESILTINMINGSDGGSYTCVAFNDAGFDSATVTLYVSPVILPMDEYVQNGDIVTLTCIADSFPAPIYQWEMMNRTSGEFEPIDEETDTTLVFDYIDYDDYGTYRCEVTISIINEVITSEEAVITGK